MLNGARVRTTNSSGGRSQWCSALDNGGIRAESLRRDWSQTVMFARKISSYLSASFSSSWRCMGEPCDRPVDAYMISLSSIRPPRPACPHLQDHLLHRPRPPRPQLPFAKKQQLVRWPLQWQPTYWQHALQETVQVVVSVGPSREAVGLLGVGTQEVAAWDDKEEGTDACEEDSPAVGPSAEDNVAMASMSEADDAEEGERVLGPTAEGDGRAYPPPLILRRHLVRASNRDHGSSYAASMWSCD